VTVTGPVAVVVVGSANVDQIVRVASLPQSGQTLLARELSTGAGGKGLNQAVAAARTGVTTAFVGAVGDDAVADVCVRALVAAGVQTAGVRRVPGPTGLALVTVDDLGANTIVVAAGANDRVAALEPGDRALVEAARICLLQLEIPLSAVVEAATVAHDAGVRVVLNAAPARTLPDSLRQMVDVLIVNEGEARELAGGAAGEPEAAGRALLSWARSVVVTLGESGALCLDGSGAVHHARSPAVQAVDTTGAGDTFAGVLAAALAAGAPLAIAADAACVAGSLAVQRPGAAAAAPDRFELAAALAAAGLADPFG
jgi:ribokinase